MGSLTQKKNSRVSVEITDKNGSIKKQVRRAPLERKAELAKRAYYSNLEKMLDQGARKIK
jgi:hypothetical protein